MTVAGIVAICVGSLMVVASSRFARFTIREQNRAWHFRFGKRTLAGTAWFYRALGIAAIIFEMAAIRAK